MSGVQFLSPRSAFKARESEDALKKNSEEPTRGRRHTSIKFGSTLSLGSRSVKETMHAAIARKNERVFGIELSALLLRERKNMPEQKRGEHKVPYIVSRITEHLKKHGEFPFFMHMQRIVLYFYFLPLNFKFMSSSVS